MNYGMIWAFRLFVAALLAFAIAYAFRREWKYEEQVALTGCTSRSSGGRYTVVWLTPWALPIMVAALWLISLPFSGPAASAALVAEFSLQLVVVLTCYFGALLLLLPLLRQKISARACATLWLLPIFLYYNLAVWQRTYLPPLAVVRVPPGLVPLLAGLWAAGFCTVVLWHMFSHFRFRRAILKDARPVEDPDTVDLWWEEQRQVLLKRHIRLVTSSHVASPLTIGLCLRSMRTVLPERAYTQEQYRLIFRHELRHVQRRDVDTKCFYIFCKALCWFNPLVWIALNRAAADLELSCDEMVVYGAEADTRKEYAALLLDCAGDDRGLSTCLSASASSLRRRLKGVISPGARTPGTRLLALVMAALALSSGLVGVSTASGTAGELLFSNRGEILVQYISLDTDSGSISLPDPLPDLSQPLLEELSGLPVTRLAIGQNIPCDPSPRLYAYLHDKEQTLYLELTDGLCSLSTLDNGNQSSILYRVDGPVDWDGLLSLVQ